MLPMGIIYLGVEQPHFSVYLMWIAIIFLVSLIPTALAAIFGAVVAAISAKFRYTSALATILSIGLVAAVLLLLMTAPTADFGFGELFDSQTGTLNETAFSSLAPFISERLNQFYPPTKFFKEAIIVNGFHHMFM